MNSVWVTIGPNSVDAATLDSFGGATPIDLASSMVNGAAAQSSFVEMNFVGVGIGYLGTQNSQNLSRQWNLVDTVDVVLGRHHLKLGMDYRRIKSPTVPAYPSVSAYFFSVHSVLNNSVDDLLLQQGIPTTPIFNETAVFVQDEWKVSSSVNLSAGLRWEVDPAPTEAHGNNAYTLLGSIGDPSSLSIAPRGTALWKTSWFNIAPRLGVAWIIHHNPGWETVARAGGGVFFDTGTQVAADAYYGLGFSAYKYLFQAPLPAAANALNFAPSVAPPYTGSTIYAFPSHLQLPYTLEWNVSVDQALGHSQTLTMSYSWIKRQTADGNPGSVPRISRTRSSVMSFISRTAFLPTIKLFKPSFSGPCPTGYRLSLRIPGLTRLMSARLVRLCLSPAGTPTSTFAIIFRAA